MKVDLSGKVSLVTGAARGIGQAIADRLAANGSRVIYADRDDATAAAAQFSRGRGDGNGRDQHASRSTAAMRRIDRRVRAARHPRQQRGGQHGQAPRHISTSFPARNGTGSSPWT